MASPWLDGRLYADRGGHGPRCDRRQLDDVGERSSACVAGLRQSVPVVGVVRVLGVVAVVGHLGVTPPVADGAICSLDQLRRARTKDRIPNAR
jgi:hypothetical protein